MKKWLQGLMVGLLGLAFFACSDSQETQKGEALTDTEIGLRKVDLQDEKDVKLPEYEYSKLEAGKAQRLNALMKMHRL